jgi:hypothetical protein
MTQGPSLRQGSIGPPSLNKIILSCKMSNGGVLTIMVSVKVNLRGEASSGNSLWSSSHIPNSSPSQARFNPDELNLWLMWSDSPGKRHPCTLGLGLHDFSYSRGASASRCFLASFSMEKASPSPLNAWLPKPLSILVAFYGGYDVSLPGSVF